MTSVHVSAGSIEFSLNLYKTCSSELQHGNIFLSPFSISVALAMTLAGAKSSTAEQIIKALGFAEFDKDSIHQRLSDTLSHFTNTHDFSLYVGNKIYVSDQKVDSNFLKLLTNHYQSDVGFLDFSSGSSQSLNEINEWIFSKTKGKIVNFVSELPIDTSIYLASAVYFKGLWKFPFIEQNTRIGVFYQEEGKETSVYMMSQQAHLKYTFNDELKFHILELPYAVENFSMLIILPEHINGLCNLEKGLNKDIITSSISKMHNQLVKLSLPKFKLEHSTSLVSILSKMGIKNLFSSSDCDLSGISNSKDLYVSDIYHKAFLDVNEEGTEATAATGVRITKRSIEYPEEIVVNHPFLILLMDKLTESVLFIGAVKQLDGSKIKEEL